MQKFEFRTIFGWMCWINVLILGGWLGLFIVDIMDMGTRNVAILVIFLGYTLFGFAVDSLMKENPEDTKKYFIEWVLASGMLTFFALTVWAWL